MSNAFVQAGSFLTNAVSASTIVVTLTGVAAGNLIAVGAGAVGANVTGVTDDKGNTYTQSDINSGVAAYYAKDVVGGTVVITVALSAASTQRAMVAHEVSGADAVAPLDGHNVTLHNPGTAGTDAATSGSFTPTRDGAYLFGYYWDVGNTASTLTAGTNFTARVTSNPGVGTIGHCSVDRIQATAASAASLVSVAGTTFTGVMLGAAFQPAVGRGPLLGGHRNHLVPA